MPETVGVDLGGTKMAVGVLDSDRRVLYRSTAPSQGLPRDELVGTLIAELQRALNARPEVTAIGLGVPATIDWARGVTVSAVNLDLPGVPLRDLVAERFGLPAFLDNDANVAALAEHRYGAARGATNAVMLTIGTGIGGGLIVNGKPFRGSSGAGAELGHVVIVADGRPCQGACTGRGHLEAYVSGTAVTEAAREEFGPSADAHRLVRLANEGEAKAEELLAEVARYLGSGIGSFVNVFGPEAVILGGGFGVAAYDYLRGPAEEVTRREALEPMRSTVRFAKAELGTAAGLIGAGFVGFEALDA